MRFKPLWIPTLFAFLASSLLVGLGPQRQEAASSKTLVTACPSLAVSYDKLPLSFEVNQGQTDARVKFLSRGSGYALFLTSTEAVLAFRGLSEKSVPELSDGNAQTHAGWNQEFLPLSFRPALMTKGPQTHAMRSQPGVVLRMELVGAKVAAKVEGLDELPGKSNYFIGNDPKKWRTNVPNYGRVKVHDLYPGVDLMYYGNQRQLEEDFVVAPGADPRAITMAIAGAEKMSIDAQGELLIASAGGEVRLRNPVVYQEAAGIRREIAGGYKLKGENRVGFELGEYDGTQPLVIDPVLAYSTYLGGSGGIDIGERIAVDSSGNAYVTGVTNSADFPGASSSPIQPTNGGGLRDVFVAKINAAGSALVYSTYLGGSGDDLAEGIAVDSAGNTYVTGFTGSPDFPTANPIQSALAGSRNAFVAKISSAGSALVYSTYLGGSGSDGGLGIAVDSSGNAYVTGATNSADFPVSSPVQSALAGSQNAFVAKVNAAGSALVYSTYLGGSGSDGGLGIAVDSFGNAYVTGGTSSTDFPGASSSPIQPALAGSQNAFVAKINAAGSALVYSTYLGSSGSDGGLGIAVDSVGNAYVTGFTNSAIFPTMPGAFQTTYGGRIDAFVTKLNAAGSALVYSTYLGGSGKDTGYGIAVDSSGNAYVTGFTLSPDFPLSNPIQPIKGGVRDAFVTELNSAGSALVYSTYLGGSGTEEAYSIAVDSFGNAYVTGETGSADYPVVNPIQSAKAGGGVNGFVAKIAVPNTPVGTSVGVQPTDTSTNTTPVTLTFSSVTQAGFTNLTTSSSGPTPPAGFGLGSPATYYSLTTSATFTGSITVCINYAGISFTSGPQLFHFEGGNWVDVTTSVDTVNQIVCGSVTSLSPFALFQPTISGLMALVNSFNLPHGTANSLLAKLSNAQASFASGNLTAACNQLNAFINEVEAQSGKKITANQANELIEVANEVETGLGCH